MNVFNSAGSAFLGPQAFAFDRTAMIAGTTATFVTPGITGGPSEDAFLPADLDGTFFPPSGSPATFIEFPSTGVYKVFHFHADFVTPGNTTFTLFASPAAAGFTDLCPSTRGCVPQLGGTGANGLDGIGDRLMFRLAYRKFVDGHESVVGNFTVNSAGVAGIRWFELRNVTAGPVTVFQEATYQPDTTWRWMGSAAMDQSGNLAIGFSASDATINPQIRYAGRLITDPINTLGQGEAHLFDGTGSQTGTGSRWGDYSAMTVDPVDDCTFWYTQEYYATTTTFNWRTRIANFKFAQCTSVPHAAIVAGPSTITAESCSPASNAIDPGETVTVNFCIQNAGNGPTTSLVGTLLNTGGVVAASGPQTYGAVGAGSTVCRPFSFTAAGPCGGTLTATIHFQDGATDLGNVTYTFVMGSTVTSTTFTEAFDTVVAPALPAGWTTAATGIEVPWVTSTTTPNSAPNDAFAPDPTNVGNTELVSSTIAVPSGAGFQLSFKNLYNMESTFDGMVLEISINGGPFADILTAGGTFGTGGYNSTISTSFASPIAGRQAWSGLSGGTTAAPAYITTTVNLPAAAAGQPIKMKWRAASDNSVAAAGAAGVRVDNITLSSSTFVCCGGVITTPTPTATATATATGTPSPTPHTATATAAATASPTTTPCPATFSENFDGVVAPALPAGWTTAATGIEVAWVTSTTNPASAPNDAFAPDVTNIGNTGVSHADHRGAGRRWASDLPEPVQHGVDLRRHGAGDQHQRRSVCRHHYVRRQLRERRLHRPDLFGLWQSDCGTPGLERPLGRNDGGADLHHDEGEPAGGSQWAEHPTEVARSERQQCCGGRRQWCADR